MSPQPRSVASACIARTHTKLVTAGRCVAVLRAYLCFGSTPVQMGILTLKLDRSGKKKRLLSLQKGDKLHARMFKKQAQNMMDTESS